MLFVPVWLSLIPSLAAADEFRLVGKGMLREVGGRDPIFAVQYDHLECDGLPLSTTIVHSELDGRGLVREDVSYEKGKLSEYRLKHEQRGVEALVKVAKGKAEVTWKEDGETRRSSVEDSENLVVGGSLLAYMGQHIADIEAGKNLVLRLVVPHLQRVIDFNLKRIEDNCLGNGAALCTELVVDSVLLRPFVKRSLLTFRKVKGRYVVLGMETLALPHKRDGKRLQEFRTRIDYPADIN
jgi:hypothetical protein